MTPKNVQYYLHYLKDDVSAGVVVFLISVPLCLGLAMAAGAPMFSGLIAGVVGAAGVVWLSGSQLSITGPPASLTVVIFSAIEALGSFEALLTAVILAGILQLVFGFLRAGIIASFFPASVIRGMLVAIGIILIIKQLPHALGHDDSFMGDESYMLESSISSFAEAFYAISNFSTGAMLISSLSLLILFTMDMPWVKRSPYISSVPAALVVVIFGIGFNWFAKNFAPTLMLSGEHLVNLPAIARASDLLDHLMFPDLTVLSSPAVYIVAITLAIMGSLETLLVLEATDKLDPLKRISPTNQELKAQGVGNIVCGLIGGLPMTAVIVRSVAVINAGGKTKLSCVLHGILLFLSVFFAGLLNTIPLASLAAILLYAGYKLVNPRQSFKTNYQKGMGQFLPFLITVLAIVAFDLLIGILIGLAVGLVFVIRTNYHAAISLTINGSDYLLVFHKDVSFLNKALLREYILQIPANSTVTIDASKVMFIDDDIREIIDDFLSAATDENITVKLVDFHGKSFLQHA